jgi:hypothetical protein
MSTMFRVTVPDGGPATVSTGVAALSTCGASEIAIMVGDTVPRQRCGSELRAMLERWADTPKDPDAAVGGTNRKTYLGAPGVPGEQLAAATVAQATAPTETQWGIVVGDVAANYLDRANILAAVVERAQNQFPSVLGL